MSEGIDVSNAGSNILAGIGGVGALGLLGRWALTWIGKQGTIATADSAQKEIYQNLQAEAKKWEDRYNKLLDQHEANIELIHQLKIQNRMMRQMLIDRGALPESVDKMIAEAIADPTDPQHFRRATDPKPDEVKPKEEAKKDASSSTPG